MRRSVFALCSVLVTSACGSTVDVGPSSGGTGGTSGAGTGGSAGSTSPADAAPPPAEGACALTFTFTTVDNNGRYSPSNVSAIWVTDPAGVFLRTLEENGRRRQSHLGAWMAISAGNTVDAVTGATDRAPREHTATWDCTALDGSAVAPGRYTMFAEFTTSNTGGPFGGAAPLLQVPFDVGSGSYSLSPPDEPLFVAMTLSMQ